MTQLIVISAVGPDRTGVVRELSQLVLKNEGNIIESRMATLGAEFAMLLLVSGHWHTISKLEGALAQFSKETGLAISVRQTNKKPDSGDRLPYAIDMVCLDQEGIVFNVSSFFAARDVEIAELSTRTYAAAHTGTPMFSVQASVNVPAKASIAQLREEFLQLCDSLNIDGIIEPVKV